MKTFYSISEFKRVLARHDWVEITQYKDGKAQEPYVAQTDSATRQKIMLKACGQTIELKVPLARDCSTVDSESGSGVYANVLVAYKRNGVGYDALTHDYILKIIDAPVTGVVQFNGPAMSALCEAQMNNESVDLGFEEAYEEHTKECADEECMGDDHQDFYDGFDSNGPHLIGDWIKCADGKYMSTETAGTKGYSAIMNGSTVQVVWSAWPVCVARWCSPCYPGQADLDSGPYEYGILCYDLPPDFYERGEGLNHEVINAGPKPQEVSSDATT